MPEGNGGNVRVERMVRLLPTFEEMYAFLREYYLYSRFEGSPHRKDYPNYPQLVTQSSLDRLSQTGGCCISQYDSRTGRVIFFDAYLTILNPDEPPAQIQHKPGHLTHLLGA